MSAPAKVVHLLQGLEVGGLENMVVHLMESLDPLQFHSRVVTYDCLGELAGRLATLAIPVELLPRRPGVDLRYIVQLARHLAKIRPDILHLHNPTAFFYGALAGRLARVPRIVYTEHGRDHRSSKRNRYIHHVLGHLVDRVIAVSDAGRALLIEEGIPERRIEIVHNGIAQARFLLDEDRWGMRERLGIAREQPLIGIVARLDPVKNHALLLRAMQRVVSWKPGSTLLVIGDGPLRNELERMSRELGLTENVRFLGNREDVPDLLAAIDVVVLCSHSEGLSLTLLEEGAAAKATIATRVGGNMEIIADGDNGLLVPPDDESSLANAICALLAYPKQALEMGLAARHTYLERFTLQQMVERYEAIYAGLIDAAGAHTPNCTQAAQRAA